MVKTFVLVLIACVLGGAGHVFLAKGMKSIGDMTEASSERLSGMVSRTVSNPWVIFGVFLQALFFAMYLMLISRADVSMILPLTAIDYIVVVFLAQMLLGETVTTMRWVGVALIVMGTTLVGKT